MKIKKQPQIAPINPLGSASHNLIYTFEPNGRTDVVIVNHNGKEEEFDFSVEQEDCVFDVETEVIELNPFRKAERTDGELELEILWLVNTQEQYENVNRDWEVI